MIVKCYLQDNVSMSVLYNIKEVFICMKIKKGVPMEYLIITLLIIVAMTKLLDNKQ